MKHLKERIKKKIKSVHSCYRNLAIWIKGFQLGIHNLGLFFCDQSLKKTISYFVNHSRIFSISCWSLINQRWFPGASASHLALASSLELAESRKSSWLELCHKKTKNLIKNNYEYVRCVKKKLEMIKNMLERIIKN